MPAERNLYTDEDVDQIVASRDDRIAALEDALHRIRAIAASPHELRDNIAAIDYCAANALGHVGKSK